jgi:hypothetical protein
MDMVHESMRDKQMLTWLDRASRWLLAMVFLIAAVPKIIDPFSFADVIGAYGLLPEPLLLPVAVLLPLTELALVPALLYGRKEGLWGAGVLMLVFMGVLLFGIRMGLDIDCGCFGPEDPEHQAFSGLRTALVRDVFLCIPLAYGYWYHCMKKS